MSEAFVNDRAYDVGRGMRAALAVALPVIRAEALREALVVLRARKDRACQEEHIASSGSVYETRWAAKHDEIRDAVAAVELLFAAAPLPQEAPTVCGTCGSGYRLGVSLVHAQGCAAIGTAGTRAAPVTPKGPR